MKTRCASLTGCFCALLVSGAADEHGLVTIPGLVITAKKQQLTLAYGLTKKPAKKVR